MALLNPTTVQRIQADLKDLAIDGWLFVNHHGMDPIAVDVLGLDPARTTTRRWWYLLPQSGTPVKIIHAVEPDALKDLPGQSFFYSSYASLHERLAAAVQPGHQIAMQYSPQARLPMISLVDAGNVELVRGLGVEVVSSADLLQRHYAQLSDAQIGSHEKAAVRVHAIKDEAFALIRSRVAAGQSVTDRDVQEFVVAQFETHGLTCENHPPIVGVNENAANPHFSCDPQHPVAIRAGDRVLLDLWARARQERSVYADICWCAFVGSEPPAAYERLFGIVVQARDRAVAFLEERFQQGSTVTGAEVDRAAREVFVEHDVTRFSVHRTGHSIDTSVHGRGANIDSYETDDTRILIPRTCFSIEPALYDPPIGVRSEINVLIDAQGAVRVFGERQQSLARL
jgi:Xaa-Pro aminopeptidase